MGSIIVPEDFTRTPQPNQSWQAGQIRHLIEALKEQRVAVVTDKVTGHLQNGVSLIRVSTNPFGTGHAVLIRRYWHADGVTHQGETWCSLYNLGPIVDLREFTDGKHQALRTYGDETMQAIRIAQQQHGAAEGRSWGAWKGQPRLEAGWVWVEYVPHVSNPAFKDRWGTPWSGDIQV